MPALRGRWQLKNASVALAALDELAERLPGLAGRGEARPGARAPAGTPAGAAGASRDRARRRPQPAGRALARRAAWATWRFASARFAVFAILADKDIGGVIDAMRDRIDALVRLRGRRPSAPRAPRRWPKLLAERGCGESRRTFATVRRRARSSASGSRARMIELWSSDRSIPWRRRCGPPAESPWRPLRPLKRARSGDAAGND